MYMHMYSSKDTVNCELELEWNCTLIRIHCTSSTMSATHVAFPSYTNSSAEDIVRHYHEPQFHFVC